MQKKSFYNKMRRNDYPPADGYLDGLEIVNESYETLLPQYSDRDKTLFVLDPPYVCTKQGAYRKAGYFGMVEFLALMRMVRPPFIFFSSTRSELPAYLEFIVQNKLEGWDRLIGYKTLSIQAHINGNAIYEDNLIYKFN
nr:hypothetical protein [Rappaport israeli]